MMGDDSCLEGMGREEFSLQIFAKVAFEVSESKEPEATLGELLFQC